MTISLTSFAQMALKLVSMENRFYVELNRGLEGVLRQVEASAKAKLGHYQGAVGDFPAWRELAEETKEERIKQGFTENDPLYRSGELRNFITHDRDTQLQGVVGVKSGTLHSPYPDGNGGLVGGFTDIGDIAVDQELGTSRIPARPFLGPAAFENRAAIQKLVGAALVTGIVGRNEARKIFGGKIIDEYGVVGYDFETTD